MNSILQGWLAATDSRSSIEFLPNNMCQIECDRYPWHKLLEEQLLDSFIEAFDLRNACAGEGLHAYYLSLPISAIDSWFDAHLQ